MPTVEGWAPPRVHVDTVVGSRLPKCHQFGPARPLHYPGDCKWALYKSTLILCLICGDDDHISEQCPFPGTSIVRCLTLHNMVSTHLPKLVEKGQCYICKDYHLPNRKFSNHHYYTKQCIHLLLALGKVCWDRKELMLEQSKDHPKYLRLPDLKMYGRPIVKKLPENQWTVKRLDIVFEQLKDQQNVPMVF